jgi:fatty-acyl-CoA synthase
MRADVWTEFQARFKIPRILEFYAATEGNVSLYNCEGKPGAIGKVPAFLSQRLSVALVKCGLESGEILRDASGYCIPCAAEEPGEAIGRIQAAAESQFDGYTDAKASAAKTISDVFAPGDRWFRTGDLMRKDRAGYFYFVDRLGDSFRWKGENVSTAEVAEILGACPGIQEAVVFGVAVPGNEGKAGMAAITSQADFSWNTLQNFLQLHLPDYARPVFIRRCQSLETTGTFKFTKAALQNEGYAHATEPVWVYDHAAAGFFPCDNFRLEWIAKGGIGRKRSVELAG